MFPKWWCRILLSAVAAALLAPNLAVSAGKSRTYKVRVYPLASVALEHGSYKETWVTWRESRYTYDYYGVSPAAGIGIEVASGRFAALVQARAVNFITPGSGLFDDHLSAMTLTTAFDWTSGVAGAHAGWMYRQFVPAGPDDDQSTLAPFAGIHLTAPVRFPDLRLSSDIYAWSGTGIVRDPGLGMVVEVATGLKVLSVYAGFAGRPRFLRNTYLRGPHSVLSIGLRCPPAQGSYELLARLISPKARGWSY